MALEGCRNVLLEILMLCFYLFEGINNAYVAYLYVSLNVVKSIYGLTLKEPSCPRT